MPADNRSDAHRPARILAATALLLTAVALWPAPSASSPPDAAADGIASPARHRPQRFERCFVIPIRDEITEVTLRSLERRIDQAVAANADLIIFDIDTPGGVIYTTLNICKHIKRLDAYTIAYINPNAYSAGAIIALACREIVMAPRSTLGDSQPIMIGTEGPQAVPPEIEAKVISPLVEEIRDSATRNGYDLNLCLAMVRPELEIYWVVNTETDERRFVTREERDRLFGLEPTEPPALRITRKVTREPSSSPLGTPAESVETRTERQPGEFVSDDQSRTAWKYVHSTPLLPQVKQPIVSDRLLLTMTQDEAIAFGFATRKLASLDDFRDAYNITGPLRVLDYTWSEDLVAWLSSPIVRGILMVLIMLGAYAELNSPGVGLPGLVALVALAIFLGAPYLTGLANVTEILLVVLGIVLLALEVFVIPGFGLAGILGTFLVLCGLLLSFMPDEPGHPGPFYLPQFRYSIEALQRGLIVLALSVVASIIGMVMLGRYLPAMPYVGRIVAPNPTPESVEVPSPYEYTVEIGDVGIAEGPLRPAGKARFGDTLVDVVSQGEYVPPGSRVEVIEMRGNRVVVRKV